MAPVSDAPTDFTPDDDGADPARPPPSPADAARVAQLFAEHNRALVRFLRTRVASDHEARDVAQISKLFHFRREPDVTPV